MPGTISDKTIALLNKAAADHEAAVSAQEDEDHADAAAQHAHEVYVAALEDSHASGAAALAAVADELGIKLDIPNNPSPVPVPTPAP